MMKSVPADVDETQYEAQQLIAQIINRTGLTASQVARRVGLSPSTLTRIYPTPTVKYTLSARTLAKLIAEFPEVTRNVRTPTPLSPPVGVEAACIPLVTFQSIQGGVGGVEMFEGALDAPIGSRKLTAGDANHRYIIAYMPSDCMEPRIRRRGQRVSRV